MPESCRKAAVVASLVKLHKNMHGKATVDNFHACRIHDGRPSVTRAW